MIIDDRNKIVFQHLPKCGGTYVRVVFHKFVPTSHKLTRYGLKWYIDESEMDFCLDHKNFYANLSHMEFRRLSPRIRKEYLLLIAVREPVSLWVSHYLAHKRNIDFKTHIENHTAEFDVRHSYSRKIENAILNAKRGHYILRQENLPANLLAFMDEHVATFKRTPFAVNFVKTATRNIGDSNLTDKVMKEVLEDRPLCEKIREYEAYLTREFYS